MKATIIQLDIAWGDPQKNIENVEQLMQDAPNSNLYVLPEMWSTGFATEPQDIAENEADSIALKWMKSKAKALQCAICGSLAIKTAQGIYKNRHYFINGRNGSVSYYDKHHLFKYGHEDKYYEPGTTHTIVEYEGIRFLLLTCYDLRFPVWSRYADALQYDAIIIVANWPESRQNLIGCNRVGDDKYSHYIGQSAIINAIGETEASCPINEASTASFLLNLEDIKHKRSKFKVLDDRDIM